MLCFLLSSWPQRSCERFPEPFREHGFDQRGPHTAFPYLFERDLIAVTGHQDDGDVVLHPEELHSQAGPLEVGHHLIRSNRIESFGSP